MTGQIRIGTSGWNYPHWREAFYPRELSQKEWFGFYAGVFDTVEINNTFYHQPKDETFEAWREQAPRGFLYAVKANRYITHLKRLKDPDEPLDRFFSGTRRLREHLGPILYQLPPRWNRNLERLESFLRALPKGATQVVEFRSRDWLCDDTYALLKEHGVGLCVHDMLRRHPRRVTGPAVYIRFHGSGKKYGGRYREKALRAWADWIEEVSAERDVFAYFNNDEDAHAISDAQRLRELLG